MGYGIWDIREDRGEGHTKGRRKVTGAFLTLSSDSMWYMVQQGYSSSTLLLQWWVVMSRIPLCSTSTTTTHTVSAAEYSTWHTRASI